jgi:Pro-kumamolisin, activation domain/MBG domain (YGX type)
MTRRRLFGLWCFLLSALVTSGSLAAYAQSSPRITQAIDQRAYVTLSGNTRPEANTLNVRGPLAASYPVDHILLFLQRSPEQEAAVDQFITSLNDKNSPNFHKWLTPDEYGQRFGVDESDVQQVTNWLQSQGFQVNQVYPNRMVIDFSGTASQIQQAFRTQMASLTVGGQAHIANMSDPQVPAALAPVIKGIASLNDFRPHAHHISAADYTFAGCTTTTSHPTEPGTCYAMTPQDNQTIYNLNPLYTAGYSGQGQTIALIEDTDTYGGTADWNTYRSTFGLATAYPSGSYTRIFPGCTNPGANGDDGEAAIDVEVASAIAPSAAIELVACPSGAVTFGGQIALLNLINGAGPYPGVVSVSYGVCESANGNGGNYAFYQTYQQAAAQGISVFTSSGDEGESGCSRDFTAGANYTVTSLGVSGWGGTPYDVSVGGTDFEDVYNAKFGGPALSTYWNPTNTSGFGSAKQYVPEIPWNDACGSVLIANYAHGSFNTYSASPTGFCNVSPGNSTSGYLVAAAGAGGASNCATGAGGTGQSSYLQSLPNCQGYSKPSFQTGAALNGGNAVYGVPSDGVRDVPDVSMFAANGVWGHYEIVCWSDPAYTSSGSAPCTGAPSTWSGFGGTSVASPTMAAVQALVNQKTAQTWGNPLSYYYQIGQSEYGTAGGSFLGTSCNASGTGGPASGCVFNDVTQGDIDLGCRYNGTTTEHHCYKPSTNGATSTDNVTGAAVINGGSGYTSAPTCTIAGPSNAAPYLAPTGATLWAGGTQATCTASINSGTTNSVWTVGMSSTSGVGETITITNNAGTTTCGPYALSGTTTTLMATNLKNAINSGCALATATSATSTVTVTASSGGYAGNVIVGFGTASLFNSFYVVVTNTTKGQGPGYVSSIGVGAAGSGYQPETPITLTGGGGIGAIAVANTTPATAAQSYQPTWGATPGYDLATGLGTPNAYNLVYASVWGTVQQPQTITFPNPGPVTYGVSPITLTATATSGLQVTYTLISGPGTLNNGVLTVTGAGTIVVQADQAGDANWLPAPSVQDSIVVNQAPVTATAGNGSSVYDGATHSPSACVVSGAYTGDLACTNNPSTVGPNVGTTTITPNVTGTGLSNYNITSVNGSYTISQASSVTTVTCPPSVTYNGSAQTPCSATATGAGGLNQALTVNYVNNVNAGTATASASFAGDANHTGSSNSTTFTINQAAVTATAGNGSSVYDGLTHSPSACVVSGAYTGNLACSNNPSTAGPNVGTTTIIPNVSGTGLSNFNITSVNGSYTISQAAVTATAGSGSSVYDGSTHSPSACVVSGAYTGNLTCSNNPSSVGPNVGTTTITPNVSGTGLSNFNVTSINGSYTISQAAVTATAGSGSSVYDGLTHSPSACVVSGAYTGNLACSNNPSTAGPNVGTTTITPNVTGTGLSNFNITSINGSYTIGAAMLTVTAGNGTMVYGGAVPTIGYTATGWVHNEGPSLFNPPPTCVPNVSASTPVGTYLSTCSGAAAPNYTIVYATGTVTVTKSKVALSITSNTPNPSTVGQGVTVTFHAAPLYTGTPTGTVKVTASSGESCTGTLSGGNGSCVIYLGTKGKIGLSPMYSGDGNFNASPGPVVFETVQ